MESLANWVHSSPSDDFWLAAIVIILVCLASFGGAFYFVMRKRIMEDTPTSKIRSAAQGYVELIGQGQVMEGPPIIAPLTGRHCTWYSYKIEKKRQSGKESEWTTVDSETSDALFLIVDDTGECVIDPEGASVVSAEKDVWYGNAARPQRGPASGAGLLSGGRYRYTEHRLRPEKPLYAIGLFNTIGGAGDVYDPGSDVRELLKEWKQDSQALLEKYDSNKDGEIDMQEWQAVRDAALKEVMARHSEHKTETPVNMLGRTRDRRRPFVLSAVAQESLTRRYQFYSTSLIALFFLSGAGATWMISVRLAGA